MYTPFVLALAAVVLLVLAVHPVRLLSAVAVEPVVLSLGDGCLPRLLVLRLQ
jgi:hypothetical protein